MPRRSRIVCHALTPARWPDLVRLFGPRGACAGCWCMWPRLSGREFTTRQGEPNRRALRRLVQAGRPVGVIAYVGGEPAGWCAVAPREDYRRFERSRVLKPVDDRPVWATPCFFVVRQHRGRGLAKTLLDSAVRYAARQGATLVEGYPLEPRGGRLADVWAWHGLSSTFRAAGFVEVARRSPTRPIMRRAVRGRRPARAQAAATRRVTSPRRRAATGRTSRG